MSRFENGGAPVLVGWEQAHRIAALAHMTGTPIAGSRPARERALEPGPLAHVAAPGYGSGAVARLASSLAGELGVDVVDLDGADGATLAAVLEERGVAGAIATPDVVLSLMPRLDAGRMPLVAVPAGAARGYFSRVLLGRRHVVCGVDRRDSSRRALGLAATIAGDLDASLSAVHVDTGGEGAEPPSPPAPEFGPVQVVAGEEPGPALRRAAVADGASLIVIGAGPDGHRGEAGSVVSDLVLRAPVPVVLA